jgi:hypothetical protein
MRQANPDRLRREGVIGHGAQRDAHARLAEERRQDGHHHDRDNGREDVERANLQAEEVERRIVDAQVELVHVGSEKRLRETLDDEAEAQSRHEQRIWASIDERPQHQPIRSAPRR